ncbi:MAG: hypothetical protein KAG56_02760 [Sulfurovaceae bacterium]|nr:hypothetical protein [Sulfurovaceae bacterium]
MNKLLLLTLLGTIALQANIKVMISNENRVVSVTHKELSDLYLGKKNNIQGVKVTPIDNKENFKEFYKKVLKKNPKQLRAYWMREMYKGNRLPPKKMTTAEISKAMKSKKKFIAYSLNKLNGRVILTLK